MAKLLFKKGSFKILSDNVGRLTPGEMNKLIKTAGTTCYQARESSKKTPEEFIKSLQKRRHVSVLEHSWFAFRLYSDSSLINWNVVLAELYKSNSLFCISDAGRGLFVSGNARIFNEGYTNHPNEILGSMLLGLHQENPVLFPEKNLKTSSFLKLERNPQMVFLEDTIVHRAMTVEFNNHSRGFTHEDVRHRNGNKQIASYSQESTRYVDYSKGDVSLDEFQMEFILPYNDSLSPDEVIDFMANGKRHSMSPRQMVNFYEACYRALRKNGHRPEEARQWLPIGIKSQIVQTYNLKEWKHWFCMRTTEFAHPEIRWSAINLLKESQKRFFLLFNDFEIKTTDNGSEYAIYTGSDKII